MFSMSLVVIRKLGQAVFPWRDSLKGQAKSSEWLTVTV
jgi:hypothetical protein